MFEIQHSIVMVTIVTEKAIQGKFNIEELLPVQEVKGNLPMRMAI